MLIFIQMLSIHIIMIIHRLGGNPIGDDGLHALSLPIKNYCKELKELWLVNTSVPSYLL